MIDVDPEIVEICKKRVIDHIKRVKFFYNKLVFDGNWKCPELFKLEFDDNNSLVNIENIRMED